MVNGQGGDLRGWVSVKKVPVFLGLQEKGGGGKEPIF